MRLRGSRADRTEVYETRLLGSKQVEEDGGRNGIEDDQQEGVVGIVGKRWP